MSTTSDSRRTAETGPNAWRIRTFMIAVIGIAVAVVWWTNQLLTERFTESTRARAEVRLALYSGNILSELQRSQIVPQLLARDPALIGALNSGDYSQSSQRLISYTEEIGAAALVLLDDDGRTVAASERLELGTARRSSPYFVAALRSTDTGNVRPEVSHLQYLRLILAGCSGPLPNWEYHLWLTASCCGAT